MKFHQDFFGAQPAQVAVVGDFDAAAIEKQMATLLGGWKNAKPFTRVANEYFDVPAKEVVIETPDKAQAFFVAGHEPRVARRRSGLSGAGAGQLHAGWRLPQLAAHDAHPRQGWPELRRGFAAPGRQLRQGRRVPDYAIYAPQNLAKLQQAFNEEIARVLAEDFTKEEVEQAKSGWLQSRGVARAQDNELVGTLAH